MEVYDLQFEGDNFADLRLSLHPFGTSQRSTGRILI